mgnify:CR=1 FL=1
MKVENQYYCSHCIVSVKKCIICSKVKVMKKNSNYNMSVCDKCSEGCSSLTNKWLILRFYTLRRDGFTCRYCGRSPLQDIGVKLEADHIHPKSKNGKDELDNLVTSCRECNSGKLGSLLLEGQEHLIKMRKIYE